jgi:hypothetical protein
MRFLVAASTKAWLAAGFGREEGVGPRTASHLGLDSHDALC